MPTTRLWPYGGPGEPYGSFAGKTVPPTHPVGKITRLWLYGGPGHIRGSFAGKTTEIDFLIESRRRRR